MKEVTSQRDLGTGVGPRAPMEEGHTAAVRQPGMCLRLEDPSESLAGRFHMAQGGRSKVGPSTVKSRLGPPDGTREPRHNLPQTRHRPQPFMPECKRC